MNDKTLMERLNLAANQFVLRQKEEGGGWQLIIDLLREAANALRAQASVQGGEAVDVADPEHEGDTCAANDCYAGNSVGWWKSKADNYGAGLMKVCNALESIGIKMDGNTPCWEYVAKLQPAPATDAAQRAVAWEIWRNGRVRASLTRPPMAGEVAYDEGETLRPLYDRPDTTAAELLGLADKWSDEAERVRNDVTSVGSAYSRGYTETLDECATELRTLASDKLSEWVMVPRECTHKMELVLSDALSSGDYSIGECLNMAIAAAPAREVVVDEWKEEAERLATVMKIALVNMREPYDYIRQALREHRDFAALTQTQGEPG